MFFPCLCDGIRCRRLVPTPYLHASPMQGRFSPTYKELVCEMSLTAALTWVDWNLLNSTCVRLTVQWIRRDNHGVEAIQLEPDAFSCEITLFAAIKHPARSSLPIRYPLGSQLRRASIFHFNLFTPSQLLVDLKNRKHHP